MKVQIPSEKKSKIGGKNLPQNREEKPTAKDHETERIKNEGANTIGEEVEDCKKNLLRNREEKLAAKGHETENNLLAIFLGFVWKLKNRAITKKEG
ncbi:Hypothetical predicted protein [Olea europaea subsp. europaea]|uniref:Uncharacterized protein n=1 Tax=Olea europaea subsp. europaea TaxID=158383 RepID=A0A8S0RZX0_OLEEU|nr:Hypothetical predicted protein [Olea europaea subsp. europaea]